MATLETDFGDARDNAAAGASGASMGDDGDLLALARERFTAGWQREEQNFLDGYEDLEFKVGEQWPADARADREFQGRPCLTINRVPQFCRQVTGDIRQMKPAMKAVPVNGRGNPDTAEVVAGLFRYIENRSQAKDAYAKAAEQQVAAGVGHFRVNTEYADDSTFNQEIVIVPMEDGLSVVWDPDAVHANRTDASYCFVPTDMSRLAYKAKYPNATSSGMPGADCHEVFEQWFTEDYVRVAEYWFKAPVEKTLLCLPDGSVEDLTDGDAEDLQAAQQLLGFFAERGLEAQIQKRPGHVVMRSVISASEVLDPPTKWPGRHFPIIRVPGEETHIGRKVVRHGVVRFLKDPARSYNYFRSAQTEVTALAPKAPFIGTTTHFAKNPDDWARANSDNAPFLAYQIDPISPGSKPERMAPPVSSSGLTEGVEFAEADMQGVTGIYRASLGDQGNESSGKAIIARQREGDTGTYVYVDNFGQAIWHCAMVVIDLIPHIYDTQRVIRISGIDGKVSTVEVNKPSGLAVGSPFDNPVYEVLHDLTVGAYDVQLDMGPAYATRREEAREGMADFIKAVPESGPIVVDVFAKMQDWPGAEDLAERLQVLLPPPIQALLAAKDGRPPPAPPAPPPPDPTAIAEQQLKQGELENARRAQDVESKRIDADVLKSNNDLAVAKHAAAAPAAPAAGSSAPAGPDPALAALQQQVAQLSQVVVAMVQAFQGAAQPPQGGAGAPPGAPGATGGPPALSTAPAALPAADGMPPASPGLPSTAPQQG